MAFAAVGSKGDGSVVVNSLMFVASIVGFCNCFVFCCALLCVQY